MPMRVGIVRNRAKNGKCIMLNANLFGGKLVRRVSMSGLFLAGIFTVGLGGAASVANADTIVQTSSLAALNPNDSVNWSSLGPQFTSETNPFTVTSPGGIGMSIGNPGGAFETYVEGSGWNGVFNTGDYLLFSPGVPMAINFATPVSGVGAYIQSNNFGNYTGSLDATAYSPSGADLGTYVVSGDNTGGNTGTAPFLGIQDLSGVNISSIVFSTTNSGAGFAIDSLELSTSSVPEPGSLALLAVAGVGLISRRRRRSI